MKGLSRSLWWLLEAGERLSQLYERASAKFRVFEQKGVTHDSNLVDSASSHTLVSKIKPCMSKYKRSCTVKLRMAHYISYSLFDSPLLHGYP